jgi:hypothetical protein
MSDRGNLVTLGEDDAALFHKRLNSLKEIPIWETDSEGRSRVTRTWSMDLVKFLVLRTTHGVLLGGGEVEVPAGLLPYEEANFAFGERNDRVWRRFLDRPESRFYVIPSQWDASYADRHPADADGELRHFVHGDALYWLVRLPVPLDARVSLLSTTTSLMCQWNPLAIIGDEGFDMVCEDLWVTGSATEHQLQDLASATSRVLTEGSVCGSYILWEAAETGA